MAQPLRRADETVPVEDALRQTESRQTGEPTGDGDAISVASGGSDDTAATVPVNPEPNQEPAGARRTKRSRSTRRRKHTKKPRSKSRKSKKSHSKKKTKTRSRRRSRK